MYIDSHMHFDDFEKAGETDAIVRAAAEVGVNKLVAIGGRPSANQLARDLCRRYPDSVHATVGLDRDRVEVEWDRTVLEADLADPNVVAVGETGLDYHYGPEQAEPQRKLFRSMLELASETGKPVVVHSREAEDDTLRLLREFVDTRLGSADRPGVLHCFTGSLPFARELVELGFYIGFTGIITFRNAEALREVAAWVPEDRLLIETDAPYLAPVPFRGKKNQPAYVVKVAEQLAELRGCSVEEIAALTTKNATELFGLA